jgi:hypothetical protein
VIKAVAPGLAEARTARARVDPDGRDMLRELWKDAAIAAALSAVSYDQSAGLLVKTSSARPGEKSSK